MIEVCSSIACEGLSGFPRLDKFLEQGVPWTKGGSMHRPSAVFLRAQPVKVHKHFTVRQTTMKNGSSLIGVCNGQTY